MRLLLIFSVVIILFSACEETIELDVDQVPPVYVVDALLTNKDTTHYVKLTKSIGFYENKKSPQVKDAEVEVRDNEGNSYQYIYSDEDSAYLSEQPFQGIIGNIYNLTIDVDGNTITASDTLRPVSPITRLQWKIDKREKEDPDKKDYFYEVTLTAKEPQDVKNYYLFKVYRNDSIQRFDSETGVFVTDDVGVGEEIDNFPGPVFYKEGDTATFELYSLSKMTFRFYSDLSAILNNDGGMFSSIPANPYNNLSNNNVVGCFQVSSVSRMTIEVGDPEHERK